MHSHRSCDIPQLRTDFSYLYIVILVYLCFPLSLNIIYSTLVKHYILVSDPVSEGPAFRLSPSQDSHASLGSRLLQVPSLGCYKPYTYNRLSTFSSNMKRASRNQKRTLSQPINTQSGTKTAKSSWMNGKPYRIALGTTRELPENSGKWHGG